MKNYVPSFDKFVNESYKTYDDFKRHFPRMNYVNDSIKDTLIREVKHLFPVEFKTADKFIKMIEDQSDETKGIKFEIKLSTGDTIHAYKTSFSFSEWEWYFNKKKMSSSEIRSAIQDSFFTPFEKWKWNYDHLDKDYEYSDDFRVYSSGKNRKEEVEDFYNKLSSSDKKKADEYMKKK